MIDLEEIKRHRALWTPDDSTSLPTICEHVDALVAEVERLRGDKVRIMLEAERHRCIADEAIERIESAEAERVDVVAWLREQAADWEGLGVDACLHEADNIERGEHRREEKP